MLRVSALSFVLRAGVKYTIPSKTTTMPSPQFRTIQARIDSILYARLKLAERDLFARLQILIFRAAGCLGKDQIYPVALVMFQLMRFMSLGASHLSNIVERFGSSGMSYQILYFANKLTPIGSNNLSRSHASLSTSPSLRSPRSLPQ